MPIDLISFSIGLVIGALLGMIAVAVVALPVIERLTTALGKAEVEIRYSESERRSLDRHVKRQMMHGIRESLRGHYESDYERESG